MNTFQIYLQLPMTDILSLCFRRGAQFSTETQKEKIETADFCALEWKFHGVNVNQLMRDVLATL